MLFHKAAVKAINRQRSCYVMDTAVAHHAKQQDRNKYVKTLDKSTK